MKKIFILLLSVFVLNATHVCSQELAAYNDAKRIPHENHSLAFCHIAKAFETQIKNGDYSNLMKNLDKLSLPSDFMLRVEECKRKGLGGKSRLFVETLKGDNDYEIWDYIKAEDSVYGAWQVYLLYKAWHTLPLFWHANYDRRTYLYSTEDEGCTVGYAEETIPIPHHLIVEPDVVKGSDGRYYVSCCYWSDFGGLIQEITEVRISRKNFVVVKDISEVTLYEYNCGIMF